MFKITREQELLAESFYFKIYKKDYSLVEAMDVLCPGWKTHEYEFIEEDGGMDIIYLVGDIWFRGWDLTGAINKRTTRVKLPKVRSRRR